MITSRWLRQRFQSFNEVARGESALRATSDFRIMDRLVARVLASLYYGDDVFESLNNAGALA
jgi:predicted methyltransferase